MAKIDAVSIVEDFWKSVWKARNPEAIDRFVVDDFVITMDGIDVVSKAKFKAWVQGFLARIDNFEFEVIETFQNEDGSRVASRWRVSGNNNGIMGSIPDGQLISFTGTAVLALNAEGKLLHNWVERSTWALSRSLRFE